MNAQLALESKKKLVKLAYGELYLRDLNRIADDSRYVAVQNVIKLSLAELGFNKIDKTVLPNGTVYSHPELYEFKKKTTQKCRDEFEETLEEFREKEPEDRTLEEFETMVKELEEELFDKE